VKDNWLFFSSKGGSELAINARAVNAIISSNIAASIGSLSWICVECIANRKLKFSLYEFCSGAIAGLVCVTPAAAYVSVPSSLIFGFGG
jgi:Amt family ammonium transporter